MSAVLKTQQMDWSKYTIDGWLEQFEPYRVCRRLFYLS